MPLTFPGWLVRSCCQLCTRRGHAVWGCARVARRILRKAPYRRALHHPGRLIGSSCSCEGEGESYRLRSRASMQLSARLCLSVRAARAAADAARRLERGRECACWWPRCTPPTGIEPVTTRGGQKPAAHRAPRALVESAPPSLIFCEIRPRSQTLIGGMTLRRTLRRCAARCSPRTTPHAAGCDVWCCVGILGGGCWCHTRRTAPLSVAAPPQRRRGERR